MKTRPSKTKFSFENLSPSPTFSDRVLFRFLIDRILFRVLNDRVFFETSVIGSSSRSAVIHFLFGHQCSFSAFSIFFYLIVLLLFIKNRRFFKKKLRYRCFSVNIANFIGTPIRKTSANSYFNKIKLSKIIQELDWPFVSVWNLKSHIYVLSVVSIRFITHCHFLLLVIIRCNS